MKKHHRFSQNLVQWFANNGRKNLPWQIRKTPYRIWVSEIMLQQTQVKTVIPYFNEFMKHFPSIRRLANASLEEVMTYWAGLGYYSRATHLHQTAKHIDRQHKGRLPRDFDALMALPGIGRSTAGAILALCYEEPYAILDGNAKRVIARQYAINSWPGKSAVAKELWRLSEELLPKKEIVNYTQALMDIGAMVCLRTNPNCSDCPVSTSCQARQQNIIQQCPGKPPTKVRPVRKTTLLMITCGDTVLLERRPNSGIWRGLLSFPEISKPTEAESWCLHRLGTIGAISRWPLMHHTFTHFSLAITPLHIDLQHFPQRVMENNTDIWYKIHKTQAVPAPVRHLLEKLISEFERKLK